MLLHDMLITSTETPPGCATGHSSTEQLGVQIFVSSREALRPNRRSLHDPDQRISAGKEAYLLLPAIIG